MTDEQLQDFRFRDTTRAPYSSEVNVRYDRFGGDVIAETADLSMEGMFIRSDEPRPVGTLVQFEISLSDGQEMVQGLGDVVWIRVEAQGAERPKGMGIQFRYIDTASRERIRRIVASYIESEGAPAAASAPGAEQESSAEELGVAASEPEASGAGPLGAAPAAALALGETESLGEAESFVDDSPGADEVDFGATVQLPPGAAAELAASESAELPEAPDFLSGLESAPGVDAAGTGKSLLDGIELPDPSSAATAQIPTADEVLSFDLGETEDEVEEGPAQGAESAAIADEPLSLAATPSLESELPTVDPSSAATEPPFVLPSIDQPPVEEVVTPEPSVAAASPDPAPEPASANETVDPEPAPVEPFEPQPSSEWDDLLAEKPSRSGLYWILGAVVLLAVFAVLGRERISALISGQPPPDAPAGVELVEAPPAEPAAAASDGPAEEVSEPEAAEPPIQDVVPLQPEPEPRPEQQVAAPVEAPVVAEAPPPATAGFELLGVTAEADEAGTTVLLRLDTPIPADALRYSRLTAPPRYVVKVRGTGSRPPIAVSTSEVQQIRTGLHDVDGVPEVHLVFDLTSEELDIEPSAEGQLVRIRLSKR